MPTPLAYCTQEQVLLRAPAIRTSSRATAEVSRGITQAQGRIDGRLVNKFSLPFAVLPQLINDVAVDLAAAHAIWAGYSGSGDSEQLDWAAKTRAAALDLLTEIYSGEMRLVELMDDSSVEGSMPEKVPPMIITSHGTGFERFDSGGVMGPKSPTKFGVYGPGEIGFF
jgi:phage gp36-like protein